MNLSIFAAWQASLKNVDCLIMTSLTQSPTMNPDTMLAEFCKTVMETTRGGGNVLVPCYPAGVVYDLLECLAGQMDLNGLSGVPMFFVSPVAGRRTFCTSHCVLF